ncbi:hypothetical protein [Telmatospirillum sp. J64-1]|uniref:hypothetical protein n=1 Tax=Telmatospirillum sp. J64-1 TaxID=2502183 RepID=UPI00115DC856|nr:hypothetical protein [Telmatospirillum sp. J64-1]
MAETWDEEWLNNRRFFDEDIPAEAERALHLVAHYWHDTDEAEAYLHAALGLAPNHLAISISAYKFFFYKNRLEDALPHAEACLGHALRRLNLGPDWQALEPEDADFTSWKPEARFLLFVLKAYGYVLVRLGRVAEGRAPVAKAVQLDTADRTGSNRLLNVIDRGGLDEEEEEEVRRDSPPSVIRTLHPSDTFGLLPPCRENVFHLPRKTTRQTSKKEGRHR